MTPEQFRADLRGLPLRKAKAFILKALGSDDDALRRWAADRVLEYAVGKDSGAQSQAPVTQQAKGLVVQILNLLPPTGEMRHNSSYRTFEVGLEEPSLAPEGRPVLEQEGGATPPLEREGVPARGSNPPSPPLGPPADIEGGQFFSSCTRTPLEAEAAVEFEEVARANGGALPQDVVGVEDGGTTGSGS